MSKRSDDVVGEHRRQIVQDHLLCGIFGGPNDIGEPGHSRAPLSLPIAGQAVQPDRVISNPLKLATYADLVALPENVVGEIIDGELIVSPRPAARCAQASTVLAGLLSPPFHLGIGGPGGWIILHEPELHLGEAPDVLVPDLAGWRRERMQTLPDVTGFTLAPDWVCEIASPSSAGRDRAQKLPVYAREGVAHAWIIDPIARTLEIFRLDGSRWMLLAAFREGACIRPEPFADIEMDLDHLWAP